MRSRPGRKVRLRNTPEQLRATGVLLDEAVADGPIDLAVLFGNGRPVEIEIGSGKGAFLIKRAADRPEINILGIEWLGGYAAYAADRAFRAGLNNVRLLCADAEQVISKCLAEGSVSRIHIYFPDPWPKRKHLNRRLIKPNFITRLRGILRLGGTVRIVTDHADYFRQIRRVLASTNGLTSVRSVDAGQSESWFVGTNFEKKYAIEGRRFYALSAIRYE